MINLEVCINADGKQSITNSVSAAYYGGASRIELCGKMEFDGLTPSPKQISEARKAFKSRNGLMVMIRPRAVDFCYNDTEINLMIEQIKIAKVNGADGVVFGCLDSDGNIETTALSKIVDNARELDLITTFHRAFDATHEKLDSLKKLIDVGVDKVLTSGTPWNSKTSALEGVNELQDIILSAQNQIEIIIGGGINIMNVESILTSLPISDKVSIHSYSGVQIDGETNKEKVTEMVKIIQNL